MRLGEELFSKKKDKKKQKNETLSLPEIFFKFFLEKKKTYLKGGTSI